LTATPAWRAECAATARRSGSTLGERARDLGLERRRAFELAVGEALPEVERSALGGEP
jgi:hypothetical protein